MTVKESVKILPNQSLFDIAIQEYGSVEAVVAIAQSNDISVTEILIPGTEIKLPNDAPTNQDILNYYIQHNIIPATAQLPADIAALVDIDDDDYLLDYLLTGNGDEALLINDDEFLLTK